MRRLTAAACAMLLVLLSASPLRAHPHVWIECEITPLFDAEGLTGFKQRWVLDEMFSASVLPMIDLDSDGVISPQENEIARSEAFDNLKHYNYFTDIRIDGQPFRVEWATDFVCSIDESKRLVYTFFVPCTVKAGPTFRTVTIGVYDHSFYCDVGCVAALKPEAHPGLVVESRPVELSDTIFDLFMISPLGTEFRFKKR
jgi:ABC-type uncharacterized transport system substrate-binding protein